MNILLLGGTVFIGRHLVEAATRLGHKVTLFNRGQSGQGLFPDLQNLCGDRSCDLSALAGRHWDAVIDTSEFAPDAVRMSAMMLSGVVPHYTFISSMAVLADPSVPDQDETCPVATLPEGVDPEALTPESFGPLKALCEQAVTETFDGRVLTIRPGIVIGPYDPTDRFTYWPRRISQGTTVLAPPAEQPVQLIDARDLAEWTIKMIVAGEEGTYFAAGPGKACTMGKLLAKCHAATRSGAEYEWVTEEFLLEAGIEPFTDLPFWVPRDNIAYMTLNTDKARAKGLEFRRLRDTVIDVVDWDHTRPQDEPLQAGISLEREAMVLAAWQKHRRLAWRS